MKPSWTLSGASNNYGSLGGLPCGIFMMVKPAHDGLWHVVAHVAHPTVGDWYAAMRKILPGITRIMTHGGQTTDPMVAKVAKR